MIISCWFLSVQQSASTSRQSHIKTSSSRCGISEDRRASGTCGRWCIYQSAKSKFFFIFVTSALFHNSTFTSISSSLRVYISSTAYFYLFVYFPPPCLGLFPGFSSCNHLILSPSQALLAVLLLKHGCSYLCC